MLYDSLYLEEDPMESMAGFGPAETAENALSVTVKVKSVNQRSLSLSLKLIFSSLKEQAANIE